MGSCASIEPNKSEAVKIIDALSQELSELTTKRFLNPQGLVAEYENAERRLREALDVYLSAIVVTSVTVRMLRNIQKSLRPQNYVVP